MDHQLVKGSETTTKRFQIWTPLLSEVPLVLVGARCLGLKSKKKSKKNYF